MLAPSYHNNSIDDILEISYEGCRAANTIASSIKLPPIPLQAKQKPHIPMAWSGQPNHTDPRVYASYAQQSRMCDLQDEWWCYEGMPAGWTFEGISNPHNLVTQSRIYMPFWSLRHRDGTRAYDPTIQFPTQLPEPDRPRFDSNFPVNEIVPMRMREQLDYGNFGDMYGYCGPYSHDWYAGRFR